MSIQPKKKKNLKRIDLLNNNNDNSQSQRREFIERESLVSDRNGNGLDAVKQLSRDWEQDACVGPV